MEMEFHIGSTQVTIAKGFINGRDRSGRSVYGLFIAAVSSEKLEYLKELFSYEQIDTAAAWETLVALLETPSSPNADADLVRYGRELHEYIDIHRLFQTTKGQLDAKQIERKISYFCSDILDVSAITFLELSEVSPGELHGLFPSLKDPPEPEQHGETAADAPDFGEPDAEAKDGESGEDERENEIFVACEPVLDPVSGVALSELVVGDIVACRLPETSAFYKFFTSGHPKFDGRLNGTITGIQLNEYGTATVALKLADGISGALRLSGTVRIKLLAKGVDRVDTTPQSPLEIVLALSSVVVFLGIMAVLLYKLS